jgi:myo-inositol 2-dehydrogenase/D-chiro-inositol 1-dehydrogenase
MTLNKDKQDLLRVGFIGAGEMATWAIFPALHFAPIRLVAVCDLDENLAQSAAAKFGAENWYTDYREMWSKENLDAVIVQTHPRARRSLVTEAMAAGYHVFVPKPPAASLAEAEELALAAKRADKVLMVNFQRRFSLAVTRAREIMRNDSFGELTQISCSFCSGLFTGVRGQEYDNPVHAFLLDMAPHHLDLARYLGGEVQSMSLHHRRSGDGIALAIALQFTSGAVGTLQLNSHRIWWRNYDRIEITGMGEYLVLDDLWSIRHYTEAQNTFTENWSDERSGELTGDGPCLIEFVQAIREQREPVSGMQDAVETMRLYEAINDAVREQRKGLVFER